VSLSQQKRRSLERRADRLLSGLQGAIVSTPRDMSPRTCVVLLTEKTRPVILSRARIQPALHAIGLHVEGLNEIVSEIEASAEDDENHYPVILLIDGWAQVAFVEARTMSPGGEA
jgi:hypothetical protein